MTTVRKLAKKTYLVLAVLVLWQLAPTLGLVDPVYLPPLTRVLAESEALGLTRLAGDVGMSLLRIVVGFSLATALALALGFVLAGAFKRIAAFIRPLMVFLSQIPPFILFPVFIIVIGVGETSILFVIVWSAFWLILFSTITGFSQTDPQLMKIARSMTAGRLTVFLSVVVPGALPHIMTGMRNGLTLAFMMLIGAETMGAASGMGWEINMAQRMAVIPRIYLIALVVAVVGLIVNYLFEWLERRLVVWQSDARSGLAAGR